jgi:DNA polymerase-1
MTLKQIIYLIDASGFIFRAYHALPPLSRSDGTPVGAVFGFLNIFLKLLGTHNPQHIGVIFDVARKTFRNEIYPAYKANRPPPPDDLVVQFQLVRQACRALGLHILEEPGFEADDLIASYAHQALKKEWEVVLVSSDKDLMQLVNDHVSMWDPMKGKVIDNAAVIEKFGVPPHQVTQVQSLIGDNSDNIPGVPGIGPKGAQELIQSFHTLEGIYDHIDHLKGKRKENLLLYKEQAFLSRELVTLKDDIPLPHPLESLAFQEVPQESLLPFLRENNFVSLVRRFEKKKGLSAPTSIHSQAPKVTHLETIDALEQFLDQASQKGILGIDIQNLENTESSSPTSGSVVLGLLDQELGIITLGETWDWKTLLKQLQPILENPSILKITHHISPLITHTLAEEIQLTPFDDTFLMGYVLYGVLKEATPQHLAKRLGVQIPPPLPIEDTWASAAETLAITMSIWPLLRESLAEKSLLTVYAELEKPQPKTLAHMTAAGINVDVTRLHALSKAFAEELEEISKAIYKAAGEEFNIGSPQQLAHVLFDKMGLKGRKKGKSGTLSTASQILENLALEGHHIADSLLRWRTLSKLKNTYTDALPKAVSPVSGRIHTTFLTGMTSTGRLTSVNPNLQNIPIRSPEGRRIRQAFIPAPGKQFLVCDYSQIELRLLAHIGQVAPLIQAFQEGRDIHKQTASEVFHKPPSEVTPEERRTAKMINFGIIYGISAFGLGERLSLDTKVAQAHIESYLSQYAGVKNYMEETKDFARTHGFVKTLWGRRCYIPDIRSPHPMIRQAAERQAINAPLQGTSADLIKRAMVLIDQELQEANWPISMILQIHDELMFEGEPAKLVLWSERIVKIMREVATLSVPLDVTAQIEEHWGEP